jgi:hypothetical protein
VDAVLLVIDYVTVATATAVIVVVIDLFIDF